MTLATSTIELLQGTPSARDGQRRGLGNEDLIGSHEYGSHQYGSHPQAASHRGARTDSDLESPDAGDDATFTSILILWSRHGLRVRYVLTSDGVKLSITKNL